MEEIRQRQDVILFIDEIHEIVGAGNAGDGNMDAGNILKPALARGELQLVGATTLNEYRIIEKDAALERRMQPVKVDEPTVEETITILRGIQPKYQTTTTSNIQTKLYCSCRIVQPLHSRPFLARQGHRPSRWIWL